MPDSDLDSFTKSTRQLADEVRPRVSTVYPAHILRYAVPPDFVTAVADGFAQVSVGTSTPVVGVDIFGDSVAEHRFDGFSVVLPESTAAS